MVHDELLKDSEKELNDLGEKILKYTDGWCDDNHYRNVLMDRTKVDEVAYDLIKISQKIRNFIAENEKA